MFWRILTSSLRHRWNRILVAALAVTMGASLTAAALSVSVGMEDKVGRTLRAYGANIVLIPKGAALGVSDSTLKENELDHFGHLSSSVLAYAPYLYAVVESNHQAVALAGTQFDAAARIAPWWKIQGRAPANDDLTSVLVGANVADKWRVQSGDTIAVRYREETKTFHIAGILNAGGAEDDQILVSLAAAQELTDRPGQVSLVQVSALTTQTPIDQVARSIEQMIPDAQARTVRQIADGELSVIRRVQLLLTLIAAIVLMAAIVSVGATMTTMMLERQREIGLMKAIGAEARRIGALFLAEAGATGVVGGIAGYALGLAFAQLIAQSVFASSVEPNGWIGLSALVTAIGVALLGSVIPVRRTLAIEAAVILRGE